MFIVSCVVFFSLPKNFELPLQSIKVKISGDGTRMSHSSNVFVCSFAIVENGQNYLSSSGKLLIGRATNMKFLFITTA